MRTRELPRGEWAVFFNSFSRHHRGRPVTVHVLADGSGGACQTLARRRPLGGVTFEAGPNTPPAVEIMLGDSPDEHLMHVVRDPVRVQIGQVTNGADEVLLIESATGPSARVDFWPALVEPAQDPIASAAWI